jgi:transcriptional antiterminator RfaH
MLLSASEICSDQPIGSWFCLKAQPKREHIAAACLGQIADVEVFCPRVRFQKSTRRGPVWFIESMFPGYLFARFDYGALHREIRKRPGVNGFVHFGERIALLPHALISEIRTRTGLDEIVEISRGLEPGQEVEITQGPFQGLNALVTRFISARERVEILIEWMGRTLRAEADVTDLKPLSGPRSANAAATVA